MAYSVLVDIVQGGSTVWRVPIPPTVTRAWITHDDEDAPWVQDRPLHVDVPLLPWVTDEGAAGYAGWALVGTTLCGFVSDGPDAELVKWDLTARLDRLLVALESGTEAGMRFVRAAERGDRAEGEARLQAMVRGMLAQLPKR